MKKFLYVVLGLIVLVVAAVFIGPMFIDGNKYRSEVEAKFKAATGYDITVKGDVSLKIFPRVQASVGNISIFNGNKNIANIDKITVFPQVNTLFKDKILVDNVTVDGLAVTLEKSETGANWRQTSPPPASPAANRLDLQVHAINIINSKLDYADKVKSKTYNFSNIATKLNLAAFAGPVSFDGSFKYQDMVIATKGSLENFAAPKVKATTTILGSELAYDGTKTGGSFAIKSTDIEPLLEFLNHEKLGKQLAKQVIDVSGQLAYSAENTNLSGLKLVIGNTVGAGDIGFTQGERINITSKFKFTTLDLDQLLPGNVFTAPKLQDQKNPDKEVDAELDITADNIIYGKAEYKNLNVKSTSENHTVSVQPLSIDFPKNGHAEMFGVLSDDTRGRIFEGHVTANSKNLPEILQSFKITPPEHKQGSLESFNLDSEVVVNFREHPSADLSDVKLTIDDTPFRGNISLDFAKVTLISLNGTTGDLDLDKYLLVENKPPPQKYAQEVGPTDDKPLDIDWLKKVSIEANLNLLIPKVIFKQEPYSSVRLIADLQKNSLQITNVSLSGKKIQVSGKGALYTFDGKKPKIVIQANVGKFNLDDFVDLDSEPPSRPADKTRWSNDVFNLNILRKVDIEFGGSFQSFIHHRFIFDNMTFKGFLEKNKLELEKADADMYGGKIQLTGSVTASAVPIISLTYTATDVDINRLLEALADNTRLSGKLNFSGSASTSGVYQLNMINNLKGSVSFIANNIVVKGFDLDGLAQQLTNTNNLSDVVSIARTVSGEQAVTYVKAMAGTINAENGIVTQQGQGIELNTAAGKGYYSGKGDLVNWNMDTNALFKIWTPDRKETPEIGIRIYGSISEPVKDINLDAIKRYISTRSAKLLLNSGTQNPTH